MLSKKELQSLIHLVKLTAEKELDCGEFLAHVAEFAEKTHANKVDKSELSIQMIQHLEVCPECDEEFQALLNLLDNSC